MNARDVRTHVAVFVDGDTGTRVQPLAEYDKVVVHLGEFSNVSVHLDRDGITRLARVLLVAGAALDAAQDEMAAEIVAALGAPVTVGADSGAA